MKSLLSLLTALAVVAALAAAGYWAYQKNASPASQNGNVLTMSALGSNPSLALTNATRYVLTVTMRQGATLVRFQLAPGKSDTRSFSPGTYSVDGNLSDPHTDSFTSQWTFQSAGKYNATFTRDGNTVKVGGLEIVHSGNSQTSGNPHTSPAKIRPPDITPPKKP